MRNLIDGMYVNMINLFFLTVTMVAGLYAEHGHWFIWFFDQHIVTGLYEY